MAVQIWGDQDGQKERKERAMSIVEQLPVKRKTDPTGDLVQLDILVQACHDHAQELLKSEHEAVS
jgi:hypothetical protein